MFCWKRRISNSVCLLWEKGLGVNAIHSEKVGKTSKLQPFQANISRFSAKPSPADSHWLSHWKICKPSPAEDIRQSRLNIIELCI